MKSITMTAMCVAALTVTTLYTSAVAQQPQSPAQRAWNGCCGVTRWPIGPEMVFPPLEGPGTTGPGMMGPGMMRGGMGFMARRHQATMFGIPAPYTAMANPLPVSRETVDKGSKVYAQHCVSCHGATGLGDGEAGFKLSPLPGNLAWLSQMPMARWDAYIYWSVADGGASFGTAMPAFKDALSRDDIWAVSAYIEAHLPVPAK